MKVGELIKELSRFNPNDVVGTLTFDEDGAAVINYGGIYKAEKSIKYNAVLIRKAFKEEGD